LPPAASGSTASGCARYAGARAYLLRTNLTESDPAKLWEYYLRLVAVEEAFKTLN
jgi:hypothetical protein